jgi:hypothetical protein
MIAETKTHEKSRRTKRVARVRVLAVVSEVLGAGRARGRERARVRVPDVVAQAAPVDGGIGQLWWHGGAGLLRVRRRCGTAWARAWKV